MTGYTLKLNPETWDLELDGAGNIATTTEAYAIAQNAANTVRLFRNDAYFEQVRGIPHFVLELGNTLNMSDAVLRARVKAAALELEGIQDADVTLIYEENETTDKRVLGGTLLITLTNGITAEVGF